MMRTFEYRQTRRGVALFAALWLVVAIGVVGLQFSLEARERRLAAANAVELLESRAAANAGIDHAQARLDRLARQPQLSGQGTANLRSQDPWLGADTVVSIDGEVGGARYEVRVRDVNSALNVNGAREEQIRTMLMRLEFDYGVADELAQSIMDWRDEDIMHRARGAEREQYLAEGRMILPRDGPFEQLPELLHVMHMTPEIYDSIAPFLIVDGNNAVSNGNIPPINVNSAPPEVLATLPGMSDAGLAGIMRARESGRLISGTGDLRSVMGGSGAGIPQNRVVFAVRRLAVTSTGWNRGGRTPVRVEAIISRSTSQTSPNVSVVSRMIR